jgi:hypothetical protein
VPYSSIIDRADAAALIPEEVAAEVIKALPLQSAALRLMRLVRMSHAQMKVPVRIRQRSSGIHTASSSPRHNNDACRRCPGRRSGG